MIPVQWGADHVRMLHCGVAPLIVDREHEAVRADADASGDRPGLGRDLCQARVIPPECSDVAEQGGDARHF